MNEKLTTLERLEGEEELEFIYRIVKMKGIPGLELWTDVRDVLNAELGYDYSESYYRKKVQEFERLFEVLRKDVFQDDYIDLLDKKRDLLYKQQVRTQDRLREYRKTLRDEGRIENLKETFKEAAAKVEPVLLVPGAHKNMGKNEAILLISDWHVGAKFNLFINEYSVAIAKERLGMLLEEVIHYLQRLDVGVLHVINLGDLVEGNIHVSTRVQSEMDVIEQTMVVGEMVASLLLNLEQHVDKVVYHHVLDNHGRINKNYQEHIEKENFGRLIQWWLEERLSRMGSTVEMDSEEFNENIGYFELQNGKKAAFVHGHLDNVNQVFQNLGGLLRESLDYVFMGHYHVAKMKEFQGGKVFVNGSLKGVDPYALDKRYCGNASQFLLVFDGRNELPIVINMA